MKVKNQISHKKKAAFASNRLYTLTHGNISELEYQETFLETGCLFLEFQYYRPSNSWKRAYKRHAYRKTFWNWWKKEWNEWEQAYQDYLVQVETPLKRDDWFEEMRQMACDASVEEHFRQEYLKAL